MLSAFLFAKVTVPGPLVFDHVVVKDGGLGNPSSDAVPARLAVSESPIVWSGPALPDGFWLVVTVTVTSSEVDRAESFPVSRRTYVPILENVAVVAATFELPKVTVPGPLTFVQLIVTF